MSNHTQALIVTFGIMGAAYVASGLLYPPTPTPAKAGHDEQKAAALKQPNGKPDNGPTKPPSSALDQQNSDPPNGPHKTEGGKQQNESPADWWAVINAALMVLFTGALAFVAHRQWLAMREQAAYMRTLLELTRIAADAAKKSAEAAERSVQQSSDQMRLDQRAWISVEGWQIWPFVPGEQVKVEINIRNNGKTPAFLEKHFVSLQIAPTGSSELDGLFNQLLNRWPAFPPRDEAIAPNATYQFPAASTFKESEWNDQAISELSAGTAQLFVVARIVYRDIFQASHTTRLCLIYNPATKSLSGYRQYNKMD